MPVKSRPQIDRFMDYVSPEPNSGCWLWTGSLRGGGYGSFNPAKFIGRTAHRWAYEYFVGPVPNGLDLDHKCRVRCCVNPAHLEPVSRSVNCHRGLTGHHRKGKTHCKNGHHLDLTNTYTAPTSGQRRCKICHKKWRNTNERTH